MSECTGVLQVLKNSSGCTTPGGRAACSCNRLDGREAPDSSFLAALSRKWYQLVRIPGVVFSCSFYLCFHYSETLSLNRLEYCSFSIGCSWRKKWTINCIAKNQSMRSFVFFFLFFTFIANFINHSNKGSFYLTFLPQLPPCIIMTVLTFLL